jgi:inner membrane protein
VDLVSAGAAAALTAGAALAVGLARVLRPGARAAAAVAGWVAVTLVMAAGGAAARATTLRAVRVADPSAEVLDVVVSPLPANPVCATVITVERAGATYRVATARVSAAPSVTPAARCGARGGAGPAFRPSSRRSTSAVRWDGEWTAPSADIATLARESCPARAALRFLRVPVWRAVDESTVLLGDARYGDGSGAGFTDLRVPRRSARCPDGGPTVDAAAGGPARALALMRRPRTRRRGVLTRGSSRR